ncbi:hypothetical protein ACFVT5_41510 [Streptomyces sp. NPDC058001]|uniref:hypothetical protein n=1 Tax=Streptomyces sp. NPDC058001 TaxID=3346300 RepID=UPI0036E60B2F
MAIELPDDLIALERSAWEAIQAGRLTLDEARAVHAAVAAFATSAGLRRMDVELALKDQVRYAAAA